jgi:hypothetical protein
VRGLDDLSSGSFDSDASVASDAVFLERMWCSMKLRIAAVLKGVEDPPATDTANVQLHGGCR